jgi:hypothetical protein
LAAAERRRLPEGKEGKEVRLISLARPDGTMESEIVWMDREEAEIMKKKVFQMVRENEPNELKALLVMLGEHLLTLKKNK